MSLTSQLKRKEIFEKFQSNFQVPILSKNPNLICPPITSNYMLVGTAFDYLLRFFIKRNNPSAIAKRWVAENSLSMVEGDEKKHSIVKKIVSDGLSDYRKYLSDGIINDELLSTTIKLAKVDSIYRSGLAYFDSDINVVDAKDIADLKNLIKNVEMNQFKSESVCFLNPAFGTASSMIGGADADIILDDMIIDIKTTKYFSLKSKDYFQLIGYYILSKIGEINDEHDKIKINNVAIYFSRYGKLVSFPVVKDDKIFGLSPSDFEKFLDWFKQNVLFNFDKQEVESNTSSIRSFAKKFMDDEDTLQPVTIKRKIPVFEKKKGATKKLKKIVGYKIFYYHTNVITDEKIDIKKYGDDLLKKRLTKQQLEFIFGDLKNEYKNTESWNNWLNKKIN